MTTVWYARRHFPGAKREEDIAMTSKTSGPFDTELEAIQGTADLLRNEARALLRLTSSGAGGDHALELAELAGAVAGHQPRRTDTPGGGVTDSAGVRWSWYSVERP